MSMLHPSWPVEEQVQKPALADFDELFEKHPALLREVMAALLPGGGPEFVARRAKFLALREWLMLSSAFAIPCHAFRQAEGAGQADPLWFCVGERWIGEDHVGTGIFPEPDDHPAATHPHEPLMDPLLRHHINLWLIQIEMRFQDWWRNSPEAIVAMLRPNHSDILQDISEEVLRMPPDQRARAVATNTHPYRGRTTAQGRIYLYLPTPELVQWRRAAQEAQSLHEETPISRDAGGRRRI